MYTMYTAWDAYCHLDIAFLQWFKEQGVVEKLVDFIHPAIESKVCTYIAHV